MQKELFSKRILLEQEEKNFFTFTLMHLNGGFTILHCCKFSRRTVWSSTHYSASCYSGFVCAVLLQALNGIAEQ